MYARRPPPGCGAGARIGRARTPFQDGAGDGRLRRSRRPRRPAGAWRGHPARAPELGQGPVQRPLQPALVARQTVEAPRRLPVLVQRPRQGRILRDLQVDRQGQRKPFVPVLALVPGQGEQMRGDAFMVRRRLHLVPLGQQIPIGEQFGLQAGGAAEAPHQHAGPVGKLALQGALGREIGHQLPTQRLEGLAVLVGQDHGAGCGGPVAERVHGGRGLARFGGGAGAGPGVASVGFGLSSGGHGRSLRSGAERDEDTGGIPLRPHRDSWQAPIRVSSAEGTSARCAWLSGGRTAFRNALKPLNSFRDGHRGREPRWRGLNRRRGGFRPSCRRPRHSAPGSSGTACGRFPDEPRRAGSSPSARPRRSGSTRPRRAPR